MADGARVDEAVRRFRNGCNCSQAILSTYGEAFGLGEALANRMACGFGGGMRRADVCGAVTGAIMVLGLRHGPTGCPGQPQKNETYAQVQAFQARFAERQGTVTCREILGCDISTPEGQQQAQADQLFTTICPEAVKTAAEILEAMLVEKGGGK
jgi:C_GCAxxG_C_C family probable redox protein